MNKIFLIGNLTRDTETKQSINGEAVARNTIAVFDGKNPDGSERTIFVNLIAFKGTAERLMQLPKGSRVMIEGSLRISEIPDKTTGEKRWYTSVVINRIHPLAKLSLDRQQNENIAEEWF